MPRRSFHSTSIHTRVTQPAFGGSSGGASTNSSRAIFVVDQDGLVSAADFDEQFPGRVVLADRSHTFRVVSLSRMFVALTTGRDRWLRLQPGEVMPEVIEAATDLRVVWSSFWPSSPADTIEFDLHESGLTAYSASGGRPIHHRTSAASGSHGSG